MHTLASQLPLRRNTTEHAGESGVQLFVGVKMEAYGDQEVVAFATSREEPSRKQCVESPP